MKRLIFCFDGSWNRLSTPHPTNVVIVAESVTPITADRVPQVIHYDPGVGTGEHDKWTGGLFGDGLIDKIVDGYTFLVFNYEPGDEIYVFGFSRGAFTARAFVGLVRQIGIMERKHATHIADGIDLYKSRKPGDGHDTVKLMQFRAKYSPALCIDQIEDAWRVTNVAGYQTGRAAVLRIAYVGVWDTVAAVGLPSDNILAPFANRHEQYFDAELSPLVVSARHAVAIDENRKTFIPTLWPNFADLNRALGFENEAADAPYQQKWFPGHHGSVGGGGDVRGLSDGALVWVLDGAEHMGLVMDRDPTSPLFALAPDYLAPLINVSTTDPTLSDHIEALLLHRAPREHGPAGLSEVSLTAVRRWAEPAANLPERAAYRPTALSAVAPLMATASAPKLQTNHPPVDPDPANIAQPGRLYRVVYGDQLRKLAQTVYKHADCEAAIMDANPSITDADRIYNGQVIFLPTMETALAVLSSKDR